MSDAPGRRGKLQAPAPGDRTADRPLTATERLLADIWEQTFGRDRIGPSDDFFDLGGDSLLAAAISARVHAATGVKIDLSRLVEAPLLADMAGEIDRKQAATPIAKELGPVAVPRDKPLALSFHQETMWRSSRTPSQSMMFNMGSVIRLSGELDIEVLRKALGHVMERHEPLRTRFIVAGGVPRQVIDPAAPLTLPLIDLSRSADPEGEARLIFQGERERPFDLTRSPLVRFNLVKLGPGRHALGRASHHLISDAPSWNIFTRDLGAAYGAVAAGEEPSLPPLPFQYADYAVWERQALRPDSHEYSEIIAWWKAQLSRVTSWRARMWLRAFMRARPAPGEGTRSIPLGLDAATTARLGEIARRAAATYYAVRLASLVPVLTTLTGGDAVVIGGIFTSRNRLEFENVFGLFAGTFPLVLSCDPASSFRQLVVQVRDHIVGLQKRTHVPYEVVREEMAAANITMPPHKFRIYMPPLTLKTTGAGLEIRHEESLWTSFGGVLFFFDELREQAGGPAVYFDARIYDEDRMADLVDRLVRFIGLVSREPDAAIGSMIERSGVTRDLRAS